jgi:hypothetical protein
LSAGWDATKGSDFVANNKMGLAALGMGTAMSPANQAAPLSDTANPPPNYYKTTWNPVTGRYENSSWVSSYPYAEGGTVHFAGGGNRGIAGLSSFSGPYGTTAGGLPAADMYSRGSDPLMQAYEEVTKAKSPQQLQMLAEDADDPYVQALASKRLASMMASQRAPVSQYTQAPQGQTIGMADGGETPAPRNRNLFNQTGLSYRENLPQNDPATLAANSGTMNQYLMAQEALRTTPQAQTRQGAINPATMPSYLVTPAGNAAIPAGGLGSLVTPPKDVPAKAANAVNDSSQSLSAQWGKPTYSYDPATGQYLAATTNTPAVGTPPPPEIIATYAHGGMANLGGTYAAGGKLLQGPGDGMSDSIPAEIHGGHQPQKAALAQGEFVIPADVVSHLGNGSTDAGARHLYSMMDRVRKARTGNPKQGKRINAEKFLPS